jgi:hypothetical protein
MAQNPNAAPSQTRPNTNQSPADTKYGYAHAISEKVDYATIIRSRVSKMTSGSAAEKKEQAEFEMAKLAKPFEGVTIDVIKAAHAANAIPDLTLGRELKSLDDVDTFMPGADELIDITKDAIEQTGNYKGREPQVDLFKKAMHWKAKAWQERVKIQKVELDDYDNKAEYADAQDRAIEKLINEALAKHQAALDSGNDALAVKHQKTANDLEEYRAAFNPPSPGPNQPRPNPVTHNQLAAKAYITANPPTMADEWAMSDQKELDRLYATFDGPVKEQMRKKLDEDDAHEVQRSTTYINNQLSHGLARQYKSKQKGAGFKRVSVKHNRFDNEVVELVDREAKILARSKRDGGKKLEGDDLDAFLATRTNAIYSDLGEKTAGKHKGKWKKGEGLSRAILNAVTGRDLEGTKVKKGWEKRAKLAFNALKLTGVIAGTVASGGTGLIVAGGLIGAGHWYMKREAKAGAERVANKSGGIAKEDALQLAIKSVSGSRLDKIRAANKLNKESNEKYTKELRRKRAGRMFGASAIALVSVATPTFGWDDWAFDRLHDVAGAVSDEWHDWGTAWSGENWSAELPPPPGMPPWYYE